MRAGFSFRASHFGREAMTDINLALLQDTGWYEPPDDLRSPVAHKAVGHKAIRNCSCYRDLYCLNDDICSVYS